MHPGELGGNVGEGLENLRHVATMRRPEWKSEGSNQV